MGASVEDFLERVRGEIRARDFQQIARVRITDDELEVSFSWMGTSVLRYRLHPHEGGFEARLVEQRMSPFHAPFRASFEERFDSILARVGAETS